MGCDVYANGDEVACKAGDGKVIAAFPDVCLSPPSPPAGPVPTPHAGGRGRPCRSQALTIARRAGDR